jgi:type I restriction enzyme S subunit
MIVAEEKVKFVQLSEITKALESGGRPSGGDEGLITGVPSLGGEHIGNDGGFRLNSPRLIPDSYYTQMTKGRIQPWDILIVKDGATTGKVSIVRDNFPFKRAAVNEHLFLLRIDETQADPAYVFHFLFSDMGKAQILKDFRGATVGGISRGFTSLVTLPLPALKEQSRIAAILDKADAIRRKRAEACEVARKSVQNFFLHQFGDPVRNIRGFDCCSIAQVAKIVTGNTPSRDDPENYGDGIEWIKSDNINTPSHYLTQSSERLSEIGERKSRPVPAGSTLVTCIAGSPSCIGNAALADRRVACNQQINAVVPGERLIDRFLYAMILVLKPAIQQLSSKSMKGMVSKGKFETLPVIVPPLTEQKKFAAIFDHIVGMTAKMENGAEDSHALFNSLVQRAFKGEL